MAGIVEKGFRGASQTRQTLPMSERTSEYRSPQESHPGKTIKQISFALACLEEGRHITRIISQLTTHQEIPRGTDVALIISDNGSRGAWNLIEGASTLQTLERKLQASVEDQPQLAEQLRVITGAQKQLRKLQYEETQSPTSLTEKKTDANYRLSQAASILSEELPTKQALLLNEFLERESRHRETLLDAMTHPHAFIAKTDILRSPLIGSEPTQRQIDTIKIYGEILSGKYDGLQAKGIRLKLASGSEMGNFGSVKEFARRAASQDFQDHHPDNSEKSHVIFIGDIDTDFARRKLIKGLVQGFSKNPDAPAMRAKLGLAWDRQGERRGQVVPLPVPTELGNLFGDITNFGIFFLEEGRHPSHIIPKGKGLSGLFRFPNLLIGPALIFRGDAAKINPAVDQGEDIEASAFLQLQYPHQKLPQNRHVRIGFNTRAVQHNPIELITNFHAAITPYWHQVLEQELGHDAHMEFRRNIFGYGHRLPLVGEIIRGVEEDRYGLRPHEYVSQYLASSSGRFRNSREFSGVEGERVSRFSETVYDPKTKLYFKAKIATLPTGTDASVLKEDEYVARKLSPDETEQKKHKLYRGERIIEETFLIRTHLNPAHAPQRTLYIAEA